jgi:hypothetical protein
VAYEFLTLQKPFKGKTLHSVLYQIISVDPDPVLTLNPEVPGRLALVVHRMLRKDPDRRYPSLEEASRDLRRIHEALRRSRSRSALAPPASAASEDLRGRARDLVARGRSAFEAGRWAKASIELTNALALDPDCDEALELVWRAGRRQQGRRAEPAPQGPATQARVVALLARAAPGQPEVEARKALAELALVAPDDPRLVDLLRERSGRDRDR